MNYLGWADFYLNQANRLNASPHVFANRALNFVGASTRRATPSYAHGLIRLTLNTAKDIINQKGRQKLKGKWNKKPTDYLTGYQSIPRGGRHKVYPKWDPLIEGEEFFDNYPDIDPKDYFDSYPEPVSHQNRPRRSFSSSTKMARRSRYKRKSRYGRKYKPRYKKGSTKSFKKAVQNVIMSQDYNTFIGSIVNQNMLIGSTTLNAHVGTPIFPSEQKTLLASGSQTLATPNRNGLQDKIKSFQLKFSFRKNGSNANHTNLARLLVFSYNGPASGLVAGPRMDKILNDLTKPGNLSISTQGNIIAGYQGRRSGDVDSDFGYHIFHDSIINLSDGFMEGFTKTVTHNFASPHLQYYTDSTKLVKRGGLYYKLMTDQLTNMPVFDVFTKVKYSTS